MQRHPYQVSNPNYVQADGISCDARRAPIPDALLGGQEGFAGGGLEAPLLLTAVQTALLRLPIVAEVLVEILFGSQLGRQDMLAAVVFAMLEDGIGRLGGSVDGGYEGLGRLQRHAMTAAFFPRGRAPDRWLRCGRPRRSGRLCR
jgi:hypothetical protein